MSPNSQTSASTSLVVVAHPDLDRSRVNAAWVGALEADGRATVRVLTDVRHPSGFDAEAEKQTLAAHDRIVLQFPFRWYAAPALLAEWLEVALEHGWAYGPGGHALEGKELTIAVSTWSRATDYMANGRYDVTMPELTSPFQTTAARVGMRYRPGFFLNGVGDLSEHALARAAQWYASWVVE